MATRPESQAAPPHIFNLPRRLSPPSHGSVDRQLRPVGTKLHLASLRIVDTSLELQGADHPAFSDLKSEFADVFGGPPPGLPPGRGIKQVLETGASPMPQFRPIKRLSEGELTELRRQLLELLDRGWI